MRGSRGPYNLERGEISASARKQVDGRRVRGGVRTGPAVAVGPPRICSDGLWRHSARSHSALRNGRSLFQCEAGGTEGPLILDASGSRSGDVAGRTTHVDLSGSLFAA